MCNSRHAADGGLNLSFFSFLSGSVSFPCRPRLTIASRTIHHYHNAPWQIAFERSPDLVYEHALSVQTFAVSHAFEDDLSPNADGKLSGFLLQDLF
jgi:hypothetical protein